MKIINRDKGPWAFAQVVNGGFAGYFRTLSGERRREKEKKRITLSTLFLYWWYSFEFYENMICSSY